MTKTKAKPAKKAKAKESVTGRYVYDAKTDRIVKVSDRIPGVASKHGSAPSGADCTGNPDACGGPCSRE